MYKALAPGCIGHGKSFKESAAAAAKAGYEGYWFDIFGDFKIPAEETLELLNKHNLRAAGFSFPVEYRKDRETFDEGMKNFAGQCDYAAKIGANRSATWILPMHPTLDYKENFELHANRLREACVVMKEYGIIFGMEFVGTPKIRKNAKHVFIYNLDQMLELCDVIGTGNAGLLLDSWHWDMAGQVKDDFAKIKSPGQIALAHINDAPEGVPADEHEDSVRGLPGSTGVLRIAEFFDGLKSVGYEGPVLCEPFVKCLSEMPFEQALETVMASMKKVWPA